MRLDKRNFPPLGLLDVENIYLDIPDSMALIRENFEAFKSPIYDLIIEGKSNILTSTENAQDYMRRYLNQDFFIMLIEWDILCGENILTGV